MEVPFSVEYLIIDDEDEKERSIPPPLTHNNNGNLLKWNNREGVYKYL